MPIDVIVNQDSLGQRITASVKKGDQPGKVENDRIEWALEPADAGIVTVAADTFSVDVLFGTAPGSAVLTAKADKNLDPAVTEEISDVANITFVASPIGADSIALDAQPIS